MLLDGRCHLYEGYHVEDITFPIHVLHACGATTLIATNASGGLHRSFAPGHIMVIDDHINLLGCCPPPPSTASQPARSERTDRAAYDPQLIELALAAARRHGFAACRGVYAAVTGPNYETRAEYRYLRRIGADAVGMSTVPEAQVAQQLQMRVLGLSIITNVAHLAVPEAVDAWHVVDAAEKAEPHVRQMLDAVIPTL
jgi:purine-nucleoside phosphorylase